MKYDVAVIGGGPGGYIAAIRASQLGKKVVLIEKEHLGGVCLNKGCIPTKALLTSAHHVHQVKSLASFGVDVTLNGVNGKKAVQRSRKIAHKITKGVAYLMKKNNIEVLEATARFVDAHTLDCGGQKVTAQNIIIATGAHYRTFPGLEHDGKRLIGAWEAVKMEELPKSMAIIGAGAIGVEFAYFWNAFGVEVSLFEVQERILPVEDAESSAEIAKAYKKYGIRIATGVKNISAKNLGPHVEISYEKDGETLKESYDQALIAVGMTGQTTGLDLETVGITLEKGFIKTNSYYQTDIPHIYAIGDVCGAPLLAHAASHEGVIAVEHLSGEKVHPLNPLNIPGCTYCVPQVASVGYTEEQLQEKEIFYRVGKLPFMANGKAMASGESSGFVKVLTGKHGELLGAHIVGENATELIHEYTLYRSMEGISEDIYQTVHPHPTLGEWLSEAVMASEGRALNF